MRSKKSSHLFAIVSAAILLGACATSAQQATVGDKRIAAFGTDTRPICDAKERITDCQWGSSVNDNTFGDGGFQDALNDKLGGGKRD